MTERTVEFTDSALYDFTHSTFSQFTYPVLSDFTHPILSDFTHPALSGFIQDPALRTILKPGYHTIDMQRSVADIVFIRFEGEVFVYDQLDSRGDRLFNMFQNASTNEGIYVTGQWAYKGIIIQNNHANIDNNGNLNRMVRSRHSVLDRRNVFSRGAPMDFTGPLNDIAVIKER